MRQKITILIMLFFVAPMFMVAQDSTRDEIKKETNTEALKKLWHSTSAKWDIQKENVFRFKQNQPEKTELSDSVQVVRLMGFSRNGEPIYYQTYNLFAAQSINTHRLWTGGISEFNLNGEGMLLNLWDGGSIRATHQEFQGRTNQMDGEPIMNPHATHVAGTMVSAGVVPTAKGMAPMANLNVYDFDEDEVEMIEAASEGALLSNHSYGRPTGWLFNINQWWWHGDTRVSGLKDYKFGYYSEETRVRDEISYLAPFYLQVHAAGNDRLDVGPNPGEEHNVFDHNINMWVKSTDEREPDGGEDGFDCMSTLVLGKNVLTVGSVNDVIEYTGPEVVELGEYSSTGPADDGRIKPDVVANGQSVLSTWVDSNTSYAGLTGTSMAAPTITGSLSLIQQLNKRLYGNYLRASTLKALIIHTAREAGENPGPDYQFGHGLADIDAAAAIVPQKGNTALIEERNLVENVIPSYSKTVYATGQKPLVATLSWTDVPGTPLEPALNDRTPLLVNDLDVKLTRVSDGQVFYPWKLDPENPAAAAFSGDNTVDNVEKIEIAFPEPGQYLVEVTHKGNIVDPVNETNKRQTFSLVVTGIAERNIDLAVNNAYIVASGCEFNQSTPARIIIENKGQQDASGILVNWQVENVNGVVDQGEINVEDLQAGTSAELDLFVDMSQGLEFVFSASVSYEGDQLPANNIFTREVISENWVVSEETYHTSFEEIVYIQDIGWQIINSNEDESAWMLRIATGSSQWASDGSNSMRYGRLNPEGDDVSTPEAADDWLVSSCLYLNPGETYRVVFDYRSWNSQNPESMKLMLGTSTNPEDFDVELMDMSDFAMDAFETQNVQFTVPEEGTYYIAFHVNSPADHHFIYLDNVFIERMVFNDLGADQVEVNADACEFSAQTPVNVTFSNLGLDPQQDFELNLTVTHLSTGDQEVLVADYQQVIESETSDSHTFLADMSATGKYDLQFTVILPNDERTDNDNASVQVINTSVDLAQGNYFTDFDGYSGLEEMGWSSFSGTTDGTGWRYYSVAGQSYSPPNSLNMYRSTQEPDNEWAFSNCLKLTEGEFYRVKFYTATQGSDSEDKFWVHLMSEASPEGSVLEMGEVYVVTVDYVREEFIFQAPYSGSFHIGLFTDYDSPKPFQIFVDDFTVETLLDYDAAVTDVKQLTWGCNSFDSQTPVQVVVENKGKQPLENLTVELSVEDEQGVVTEYTLVSDKILTTTQKDTLVYDADLSALNTIYSVTAAVLYDNDQYAGNDLLTVPIRNTTVDLTQGQVYFNDFEYGEIDGTTGLIDPTTGWSFENSNGDYDSADSPITWIMRRNDSFANSGEISMRSGRNLEEPADDWMFSNCLVMQAGENYLLEFYFTGRTNTAVEKMSVYVGDSPGSSAMNKLLFSKTFSTVMEYQRAVVAFTPTADGTYYIGFHAHSDADQSWIYVDDFKIQKNHEIDISLDNIEVLEEPCSFTDKTPFRINFRNSGNSAIDQPMKIDYQIISPDGKLSEEGFVEIDQPLQVNQESFVDLEADLQKYGIYTLNAQISFLDDQLEPESGNNSFSANVFSTALNPEAGNIYLSFEQFDSIAQTGWTVYDANNDGFGWDLGVNYTTYSYSGNRVMYYSFSAANDADDWLFSGCANLRADSIYVASFFYRVYDGDYSESMKFGLATSPHPDDVIQILDEKQEVVNYNYRKVSYAFSVPQDGQYYFAWQAFSENYRRFIFVDDFSLAKAKDKDGAVYSIEAQAASCDFNEQTPVKAVISNLGSEVLPGSNLEIEVVSSGDVQQISVAVPQVPVLGSAEVVFDAAITNPEKYTFNYKLVVEEDNDTLNNSGNFNIFGTLVDLAQPGSWFIQDFETIFAMREIGWSIYNLNSDNRYWGLKVNDPPLAYSGHNYLVYYSGNQVQAGNDWIISGCYNLEAGRKYKGAFFYRLGSGSHNLKLAAGTSPDPESMQQLIWEDTQMSAGNDDSYKQEGDIFEVSENGLYYFGIQQFSQAGQGSSLIDDLVIIAQPQILPLDEVVETGSLITINALGSDSLRWFSDAELTQLVGQGTTLEYLVEEQESFRLYAAEFVYDVMGPADTLDVDVAVGVADHQISQTLNVYPNPAREKIFVSIPSGMSGRITAGIYNIVGEKLMTTTAENSSVLTIDVSDMKKGIYIIELFDNKNRYNGRFVIN